MHFDLRNSPASFQRMLDILLSGLKLSTCIVYVGDVIVYSDTLEDHLEHVDRVLTIVQDTGVAQNIAEYHFFRTSVN